jgi:hypothetical protein
MKAFLEIAGSGLLPCSASKYLSTSTFGGSCSVTTLKWTSVCAGHDALIIFAAFRSSAVESGARGCEGTDFAVRGVSSVAISVDILTTGSISDGQGVSENAVRDLKHSG